MGTGRELEATVEVDGLARMEREGRETRDDPLHDRLRFPIGISQQQGEAANSFDQGGHVRRSEFLAELDQVTLPVSKFLTSTDGLRAVLDRQFISKFMSLSASLATASPTTTMLGQMSPEIDRVAIFGIGELIDSLVADLQITAVRTQATSDLLRRPACLQPVDDDITEVAMPDQFAQSRAAGLGFGLGVQGVVARQFLDLCIDKPVPLKLAMDRGTMAAEALGVGRSQGPAPWHHASGRSCGGLRG